MKKEPLKLIVIVGILISANFSFAQTANNKKFNDSESQSIWLNGFDEAAIIIELKQKGIRESEYSSIIREKKKKYIDMKMGAFQESSVFFAEQKAPITACDNSDFEFGDFTNWTGATGTCDVLPTTWTPGFVTNRHTIVNGTGYDPIAINTVTGLPEIPLVAPGGLTYSSRLGNSQIGAETEYLRYPFTVTSTDTFFTYQYAVVLENPGSHTALEQPKFDVYVFDSLADTVYSYSVQGIAASTDSTFKPFNDSFGSLQGYYKKWTSTNINLSAFIGTTVTIQFQTNDCTLTGHFGYAYVDCSCTLPASVSEILLNNSFKIYPNPTNSNSTINFNLSQDANVEATLINMLGERIITINKSNMNAGSNEIRIDSENINTGIYLIQLKIGENIFTKKLVVSH